MNATSFDNQRAAITLDDAIRANAFVERDRIHGEALKIWLERDALIDWRVDNCEYGTDEARESALAINELGDCANILDRHCGRLYDIENGPFPPIQFADDGPAAIKCNGVY